VGSQTSTTLPLRFYYTTTILVYYYNTIYYTNTLIHYYTTTIHNPQSTIHSLTHYYSILGRSQSLSIGRNTPSPAPGAWSAPILTLPSHPWQRIQVNAPAGGGGGVGWWLRMVRLEVRSKRTYGCCTSIAVVQCKEYKEYCAAGLLASLFIYLSVHPSPHLPNLPTVHMHTVQR